MLHRSVLRRSRTAASRAVATGVTAGLAGAMLVATTVAAPAALASPNAQHGTVSTRPSDQTISFVDGVTYSIAQVGPKVFVGGTFTQVGPGIRGAAGVVDVASSTFGSSFPDVVGAVYAAVPDGNGGYFLGGDFTSVGGQSRSDLAQVDSTGAVTTWAPTANATVRTLALGPDGLYVGGDFSTLDGAPAGSLGKVDTVTGALLWNGNAVGGVVRTVALSADASTLYVGGAFTSLGGNSALKRLGAVAAATGVAAAGFAPGTVNQIVYALAVQAGTVWLGGDFTAVNGITRQHLPRVDGSTGALMTATWRSTGTSTSCSSTAPAARSTSRDRSRRSAA